MNVIQQLNAAFQKRTLLLSSAERTQAITVIEETARKPGWFGRTFLATATPSTAGFIGFSVFSLELFAIASAAVGAATLLSIASVHGAIAAKGAKAFQSVQQKLREELSKNGIRVSTKTIIYLTRSVLQQESLPQSYFFEDLLKSKFSLHVSHAGDVSVSLVQYSTVADLTNGVRSLFSQPKVIEQRTATDVSHYFSASLLAEIQSLEQTLQNLNSFKYRMDAEQQHKLQHVQEELFNTLYAHVQVMRLGSDAESTETAAVLKSLLDETSDLKNSLVSAYQRDLKVQRLYFDSREEPDNNSGIV